jgi:hypothetical protein
MKELSLQEKGYLSSKDAGALLGYTHDYISRLCRHGKMSGIQKGREWFVTPAELEAFKQRHEVELQEKKIELSKKFSQIRLAHEAKKRKARESGESLVQKTNQQDDSALYSKKIKFTIPRQFVALAVLGLLLLTPAIFDVVKHTPVTFQNNTVASTVSSSPQEFTSAISNGIKETLLAQSTAIQPVASVFAFAPHLAEGYWQFFMTISKMPKQVSTTWISLGNSYLALYLLQGESLYASIQGTHTLGASVLGGYELFGKSFLVGSKDTIDIYKNRLNMSSQVDLGKKKLTEFASNVEGGLAYANQNVSTTFLHVIGDQIGRGTSFFLNNVGENIFAMGSLVSDISHALAANMSSIFDFKFTQKDSHIRTIKIEE